VSRFITHCDATGRAASGFRDGRLEALEASNQLRYLTPYPWFIGAGPFKRHRVKLGKIKELRHVDGFWH
jgi:hypothetical protein